MKICFVSYEYPPNIYGGAGIYAKELVNGLSKNGHEVLLITRGQKNNRHNNTITISVKAKGILGRLFFIRNATALINALMKSEGIEIVHFNEPHLLTKPDLPAPTLATFHSLQSNYVKNRILDMKNNLQSSSDLLELLTKNLIGSLTDVVTAHSTKKIICPSPTLAKEIACFCHIDDNKVRYVPNGINLNVFDQIQSEGSKILNSFKLEKNNYLLYMGRLEVMKGVQYLIEAFKNIKADFPNLKLVICGFGEMRQKLEKTAPEGTIFTGYISKLPEKKSLMENSLMVIIPSIDEAMPMVALEAMAASKPIVASCVGGLPYLIKNNLNGLLIKPRDIGAIENSIKSLMKNKTLRTQLGNSGRKNIEQNFTSEQMIVNTVKVYEELLNAQ